ncbi:hypothetical protein F4X33_12850, partial [Candidatus Poribacteria bacterium]|nr:hypothetical protein [Candidatus Poribacteria bacterium]
MSSQTQEMRTIFFNGPKGHRWVTTVSPTDKAGNHEGCLYKDPDSDDRAADRRRFFGFLNVMRARLERHGVSGDDVRWYYAKRFGTAVPDAVNCPNSHGDKDSQPDQRSGRKMSGCSQREWAIAAAEVQAMFQSREIFADRIAQFKAAEEKQCPDQERLPSKSDSRKSCSTKQIGANKRSWLGFMLLPPGSRTSTHSAIPSP